MPADRSILERWGISEADLTEIVAQNPSLRGMLLGYVAEKKLDQAFLSHLDITSKVKDDDHNRKKKGDRRIVYRDKEFTIEVKSLQTNMVKLVGDDQWVGKSQVDASDKRTVRLPNGKKIQTTCLLRGEFDILAVNCFAFGEKWRFAFALNKDLPKNTYRGYKPADRKYLLPTLIEVKWPLEAPFCTDPMDLLKKAWGAK